LACQYNNGEVSQEVLNEVGNSCTKKSIGLRDVVKRQEEGNGDLLTFKLEDCLIVTGLLRHRKNLFA